jgi:hypothetical protein
MWERRGLKEGIVRLTPETNALFAVHLLAYFSSWNTIARTQVIRDHGGFFDTWRCLYAEDSFLFLKVLLNHHVAVQLQPLVSFHTEASGLSHKLSPRRVEPMLLHPEEIEADCPDNLRPLLSEIITIRAHKTACVLSYWGKWKEARELLRRFSSIRDWRSRYYFMAQLAATPLGAVAGSTIRSAAKVLDR